MTREDFNKRREEDEEWTPGWDAIEEAFGKVSWEGEVVFVRKDRACG